jgi:ribulose-phosphate 3-epimerase
MLVGASLLSLPLFRANNVLQSLSKAGIDYWHIDVMDGNFVPNLALNAMWVQSIKEEYPSIPLDVHFMTTEKALQNVASSFLDTSPLWFSFHNESISLVDSWIQSCKKKGIQPGLAISPETSIDTLKPYLSSLSFVLLMSVEPGFGGQQFRKETYSKIEALQNLRARMSCSFRIQVDGGIQLEEAKQLQKLNVDMIVMGSYLVHHPHPSEVFQRLSELS